MKLRALKEEDAQLMLEWMHDKDVVKWLGTNFSEKTIEDCIVFIKNSRNDNNNLNLAIVDENDIYMGTVSLKHIDKMELVAEFAITIRKEAMGKGFSKFAMAEIIRLGFAEMYLKNIVWCVAKDNIRARKFYDKNNYQQIMDVPSKIKQNYTEEQLNSMIWYEVKNADTCM